MSLAREPGRPVGALLRGWRERRRLTQLDLAERANVSTRHISFVENGRSRPTSEMIILLSKHLDVPLRERNQLLLAGGYAPAYSENGLASPSMSAVSAAIDRVLAGLGPLPAAVIDRRWELVAANDAIDLFTAGAAARLLEPPVNVLRLSLHPEGMAPRILNLPEWRAHLLDRLARQADATGDQVLRDLHTELSAYPVPGRVADGAADGGKRGRAGRPTEPWTANGIIAPVRYRSPRGELSLFTTTTVFGTPTDVTVSELAVETFFPADAPTASLLYGSAGNPGWWQVMDSPHRTKRSAGAYRAVSDDGDSGAARDV
ncbi:helix-turn-helix transcriptional regulator [Frankia sp. Mgl5]|uniref:helix-turn-helix domain-containing protein n=1 Tax=Frankia sp. Mgl5 TaxID=2933793 RepID=UPI0020104C39|nr:helix-turn-helix transcriptional regulator [Frankia sp. Mgl5]MCK9925725.1 helix-turn-helix transcriptional regulator [Frankia sp. Mgl5]